MKKMFLILVFTIFLVGLFNTPAFGANQAITFGTQVLPYMLAGEFEFKITENSTICVRTGATVIPFIVVGVVTGTGAGYRWYYSGEALDGFYCGAYIDYLTLEGTVVFFPDSSFSESFLACQGVWGYKKVLGGWFVFDLGVSAYAGETENGLQVIPGIRVTVGVAF